MQILLAFDGDEAGREAALKAIPAVIRGLPKVIVGFEFAPGVVMYRACIKARNPRLMRWKRRYTMPVRETTAKWHADLRRLPDWELELWIVNHQRDICEYEYRGEDVSFCKGMLGILQEERVRRLELVARGAPEYDPGTARQQDRATDRVRAIKDYYTGSDFIDLFEDVTGIRPFPAGTNHWKYACPLHGDGVDKTPAGSIDPSRGLWHCFACGSGGDVFQLFYAWPPHLTFRESVDELWARIQPKVSLREEDSKWN